MTAGMRLERFRDDQAAHIVMAEVGAAAHRLDGGGLVGVAERQLDHLLDQAGAGAAARRRLGVGAHAVEGRQALRLDRLDDLALAYAVAAADFRIIRQRCNGRRRVQRGASLRRLVRTSSSRACRKCRRRVFSRSNSQAPCATSP